MSNFFFNTLHYKKSILHVVQKLLKKIIKCICLIILVAFMIGFFGFACGTGVGGILLVEEFFGRSAVLCYFFMTYLFITIVLFFLQRFFKKEEADEKE
ncbi:MAG: hypothetical protein GY718_05685 [Lentisphaerae bacterium]|nr:hypothetical protein [Lentisphaerota bacterium]